MKHIIITGASSGIGHELTANFLKRGYFVWGGVRNPETLANLKQQYPQTLEVLKLDVTSNADIESAFQKISQVGVASLSLVNNAGLALGGPIEAIDLDEWRKLFDVNVFGLLRMTQVFLPLLRKTKGRVINIGSISGRMSSPFLAPYTSSKYAVRAITDSLRRELRTLGVKVVLIEPGPIKTDIWDKSIQSSRKLEAKISPELHRVYGEALENLVLAVEDVAKNAVPISFVTEKVVRAVELENPYPYYLVGKGIHLQALVLRLMPVRWLDAIFARGFRFQKTEKRA
ncbi:SDR family oxidoreductase [Bdellovibrio svalbardensis]|uniref:SDR family oxidoreductase n=1 Tax=Bdellovibrio svalbardensis TaxID=2972972 RepID=A0ABT6DEZ7_9BACT|nr:SDR family oxidoreductase [Bdellovibrio svalbardensis]MDG0815414.1 SDR family oxidoreductase [Bdellovibrio svalbardensis]